MLYKISIHFLCTKQSRDDQVLHLLVLTTARAIGLELRAAVAALSDLLSLLGIPALGYEYSYIYLLDEEMSISSWRILMHIGNVV